jgi:hypothetical protein
MKRQKMSEIWYTARAKFDPGHGPAWDQYLQWVQLPQLTELLTLDIVLCPEIIQELTPEDWEHNVHQDHRLFYFRDLDYLLGRLAGVAQPFNLLAVIWEPPAPCHDYLADPRFQFTGYDLVEEATGISALTNCGGFPLAFPNQDLSPLGLLPDYDLAKAVQARLRQHYPNEHHAQCDLWGIWQMRG